jgi:hypothetical protein
MHISFPENSEAAIDKKPVKLDVVVSAVAI